MFKNKICLVLLLIFILGVGSINVFAASSGYSFYMENRMVNGKNNGEYHYLDKGSVMISGSGTIVGGPSTGSKNKVHFTLVKDGFFGKEQGTVIGDEEGSVYGGYGSVEKGKYYLQIWIADIDGYYRSGSGKVYNN